MSEESYTIDQDEADAAERAAELRRARDADAWNWVMADPRGRRVLWGLMESTQTFHDTFDEVPTVHARNAGRRAVGLEILATIMGLSPATFGLMQTEGAQS